MKDPAEVSLVMKGITFAECVYVIIPEVSFVRSVHIP